MNNIGFTLIMIAFAIGSYLAIVKPSYENCFSKEDLGQLLDKYPKDKPVLAFMLPKTIEADSLQPYFSQLDHDLSGKLAKTPDKKTRESLTKQKQNVIDSFSKLYKKNTTNHVYTLNKELTAKDKKFLCNHFNLCQYIKSQGAEQCFLIPQLKSIINKDDSSGARKIKPKGKPSLTDKQLISRKVYSEIKSSQEQINWYLFVPVFLIGLVGVILVQFAKFRVNTSQELLKDNLQAVKSGLAEIVEKVRTLNAEKGEINIYDIKEKIDEFFPSARDKFVTNRETIGHIYGLNSYADVMNNFAAGERYLNRVWSCSVDGYIDESNTFLEKASEQFTKAQILLLGFDEKKSPESAKKEH